MPRHPLHPLVYGPVQDKMNGDTIQAKVDCIVAGISPIKTDMYMLLPGNAVCNVWYVWTQWGNPLCCWTGVCHLSFLKDTNKGVVNFT